MCTIKFAAEVPHHDLPAGQEDGDFRSLLPTNCFDLSLLQSSQNSWSVYTCFAIMKKIGIWIGPQKHGLWWPAAYCKFVCPCFSYFFVNQIVQVVEDSFFVKPSLSPEAPNLTNLIATLMVFFIVIYFQGFQARSWKFWYLWATKMEGVFLTSRVWKICLTSAVIFAAWKIASAGSRWISLASSTRSAAIAGSILPHGWANDLPGVFQVRLGSLRWFSLNM